MLSSATLAEPVRSRSVMPSVGQMVAAAATGPRKTRVYVAVDSPIIAHGVRIIINGEPDMEVCGDSDEAARALEEIRRCLPDIVIVGVQLKDSSGLEFAQAVRRFDPRIMLFAMPTRSEMEDAERILMGQVDGYLFKHDGVRAIPAMIRLLQGGIISAREPAVRRRRRVLESSAPV
jgi:DNA-binding NarL/FixJ family response regulator